MTDLATPQTFEGEIVLTERRATSEFIITDIHESITNKFVRVEIELGPFVTDERPFGQGLRGSGRRGINVWSNESYDEIAATWDNESLLAAVTAILIAEAVPVL